MNFLVRRAIVYLSIILIVINLIFFIPRLIPGNAAQILASASHLPSQEVNLLEARFGLNQPLYVQYYLYLKGALLTWPPYFGVSFQYYPSTVSDLFIGRLPWSLLLIGSSFILSIIIAYFATAVASSRRAGKFDIGSFFTAISFHATPVYWTSMLLLWVFSATLHWLPIFGNVSVDAGQGWGFASSVISHAILPVIAMTSSIVGEVYLVLRSSTQQVLRADYVLAAETRGLKTRIIEMRYVLRNSLLPLVSLLSFSFASMIGRVVLVESVFGYPGIGDLFVDGITNRDYPVLEGAVFYVTLIVVIGGFIGDLLLLKLDPRLRSSGVVNS